jgi:hypothetical protein
MKAIFEESRDHAGDDAGEGPLPVEIDRTGPVPSALTTASVDPSVYAISAPFGDHAG